jgi:acetyltransferase-like isoleucine patch superfamily enzyme
LNTNNDFIASDGVLDINNNTISFSSLNAVYDFKYDSVAGDVIETLLVQKRGDNLSRTYEPNDPIRGRKFFNENINITLNVDSDGSGGIRVMLRGSPALIIFTYKFDGPSYKFVIGDSISRAIYDRDKDELEFLDNLTFSEWNFETNKMDKLLNIQPGYIFKGNIIPKIFPISDKTLDCLSNPNQEFYFEKNNNSIKFKGGREQIGNNCYCRSSWEAVDSSSGKKCTNLYDPNATDDSLRVWSDNIYLPTTIGNDGTLGNECNIDTDCGKIQINKDSSIQYLSQLRCDSINGKCQNIETLYGIK